MGSNSCHSVSPARMSRQEALPDQAFQQTGSVHTRCFIDLVKKRHHRILCKVPLRKASHEIKHLDSKVLTSFHPITCYVDVEIAQQITYQELAGIDIYLFQHVEFPPQILRKAAISTKRF